MTGMTELEQKIGYEFRDSALLALALSTPSVRQSSPDADDNQRLEFLGDAVLEFCVSDMLYHKYTDFQEGALTARRAALVCERTLSVLAHSLDLGRCLVMGHGEEQTGGREKPSILADAMEAVFAAIKGRMAQFVATQRQFRNPKLHWLYVRLGVIPKMQFHTDPRCVMNILRVLKNGGAIVLSPALVKYCVIAHTRVVIKQFYHILGAL